MATSIDTAVAHRTAAHAQARVAHPGCARQVHRARVDRPVHLVGVARLSPVIRLPLTTPRLTLRMMDAGDIEAFAAYRADADIARFQDWAMPFTVADAAALIAGQADLVGPTPGQWVQIAVDGPDGLVGDVAVGLDDDGTEATIGYTLAPGHHGLGYATEATGAIVEALFTAGVRTIRAGFDPENTASRAVLERLGFEFDSLGRVEVRGEMCDDEVWVRRATRR